MRVPYKLKGKLPVFASSRNRSWHFAPNHAIMQGKSGNLKQYVAKLGLIDWVKVLRPTEHKIGHFGDVPVCWFGMEKLNLTQQKHACINQNKCTITQNKHKKLKSGLVVSYDIRPGNGQALFLFRCFINASLTYLLRHLLTYSPGPTLSGWVQGSMLDHGCTFAQPGEYDWTVRMRRQCGLFVKLLCTVV